MIEYSAAFPNTGANGLTKLELMATVMMAVARIQNPSSNSRYNALQAVSDAKALCHALLPVPSVGGAAGAGGTGGGAAGGDNQW